MRALALAALITLTSALPATAQQPAVLDFSAGWAGFADESVIHHVTFGSALRFPLGNRVSLGPEFVFMSGPERDRDLFAHVSMAVLLREPSARVRPYLVVSGGPMWHRSQYFWIDEWFRTWNANAGFGLQARVGDRLSIGAETRLGSELELRVTAVAAYALK